MGLSFLERQSIQVALRCANTRLWFNENPFRTSEEVPHPANLLLLGLWEDFQLGRTQGCPYLAVS